MKILFLDDDFDRVRIFQDNTGIKVRNVRYRDGFKDCLWVATWDLIMLDHDLGPDCDTLGWNGTKAAEFLAENPGYVGAASIILHSDNSYGVLKMLEVLKHNVFSVSVIDKAWLRARTLNHSLFFLF